MKKLVVAVLVTFIMLTFVTPSPALNEFKKEFANHYELAYPQTSSQARLAERLRVVKCNLCHVPNADKEIRNKYGKELERWLDARNYSRTRVAEEPRKVHQEILDALLKAEQAKSSTGETYGDRIRQGLLPLP